MAEFELIEEDERRKRFARFADAFEGAAWKDDGPWALERALFYRSLARDPAEVAMAAGYASPAWSLVRNAEGRFDPEIERNWQIYKAHKRYENDPPVHMKDGAPYKMFSGSEIMHDRIAARPEYRVERLDKSFYTSEDRPLLQKCMKGVINVDLGTGNGTKLRFNHEQLGEEGQPQGYYLIDIAREALLLAKEEMCKAGVPSKKVQTIHADFYSENFWQLPFWKKLLQGDTPIVISCYGSTPLNSPPEKFQWLLGKCREKMTPEAPNKLRCLFILAKTRHVPTLRQEYDHYFYKQFFTGNFYFGCHLLGIEKVDLNKIDCNIDFDIEHHHRITMKVVNTAAQEVVWKPLRDLNRLGPEERAARFVLPEMQLPETQMPSGLMYRLPDEILERFYANTGNREIHRLAYRPKDKSEEFVRHDLSILAAA